MRTKKDFYVIAEDLEKIAEHLRFLADEACVGSLPQPCLEVSEMSCDFEIKAGKPSFTVVERSGNSKDVTGTDK